MIHGFENAFVLLPVLQQILERNVTLKIYTDSKSLYHSCTRLAMTSEKRFLIALALFEEDYDDNEIFEIVWVLSSEYMADAIAKLKQPQQSLREIEI